MWFARSKDEGATFGPEQPALDPSDGGLWLLWYPPLADRRGNDYIFYRAATEGSERDIYLLSSDDHGEHFPGRVDSPLAGNICPMSSASLGETGAGVLAAWETRGEVQFCRIDPKSRETTSAIAPPGDPGGRKHPAVAGNSHGETILVWTEGTGWQKGGLLVWQVFDRSGHATERKGRIDSGVPVWGLATVVPGPDR